MAHTFLSPVINKLAELLVEEVRSLRGVDGEVNSLKDELEIMEPLLKVAEAKSEKGETNDVLKAWLKQLREQSHHIECVIDEYRYHLREIECGTGFNGTLRRTSHFIKSLKPRHEIASKVQSIKKSLSDVKSRARDYGLRPLEPTGLRNDESRVNPRMDALFLDESEYLEIKITADLITNLTEGQANRSVITLVGEGGIGKTALAKRVFEDKKVRKFFGPAHAWITVSQPYNVKKVLKKTLAGFGLCRSGKDQTIEGLIQCLRNFLHEKRYMVVFDDVWEERFWEDLEFALPQNRKGSRILITTRNGKIAESCKTTPFDLIRNLQPWDSTLSLELFCKTAFQYKIHGENFPEELQQLSLDIVRKCQGLPLVIATIARLLANKEKVVLEWERVLKELTSKESRRTSGVEKVLRILSLSYYDLPHPIRSCFLCFGIFPEDYSISDEKLCSLWIAEGFIEAKRDRTLKEVAIEHLNELVKRNLVLVDSSKWVGEGNFFRVHDLMREVIISKADELCFYLIWNEKNSSFIRECRRLAVYGSAEQALKNVKGYGIRSLFLTDVIEELTKPSMLALFKKLKLLEVFDVQNAPLETLPKEVGSLYCLKYLSLRNTKVKSLPKSISNLHNLQSLDIRNTLVRHLPKEVNKLKNLVHLLAYKYNHSEADFSDFVHGVTLQKGFGNLTKLQTLTAVEAGKDEAHTMEELAKLENLRWLGVLKLTTKMGKNLCASIEKMPYLERLCLNRESENQVLDLKHISSTPKFLKDLVLVGRLEKMPDWIAKLENLSGLTLYSSNLIDGPIEALRGLPNLESLYLGGEAYCGEELKFEGGGFGKLKKLLLCKLEKLKKVRIDGETLKLLEQLHIDCCPMLMEFPSVEQFTNIKFVRFNGMDVK